MSISFQGRSGPITQTVSRNVSNIIYNRVSKVEITYTNYYYSPNKNFTPHFFEEFKEGISFYSIASTLYYNNLELDNTTINHNYPNGWRGSVDSQVQAFYGHMGNRHPPIENYSSYYDQLNSPEFTAKINRDKNSPFTKFILLSNTDRTTATVPLEHSSFDSQSDFYKNDMLHFSLGANGVYTDATNNILTVNVYRSTDTFDRAIGDLKKFHSKRSSTKVAEYQFESPTANEWKPVSINLRTLDIPDGSCLLWFEFVRFPSFPKNPFPALYAPWDQTLINNTWYNFEHDNTFSYRDLEPTNWVVNTNNVSMEFNADPGQKMMGRVSGEEHENYIFETVVKSTSAQGDAIGVVIGFVYENGYEYTLSAYRSQGGPLQSKTWFAVANAGQSISFSGEEFPYSLSSEVWDGSSTVSFATNSWVINNQPTMTKIRVEKNSTEVKLYTSPIGTDVIDLNTEIIIPLTGENERFKRSKIGFTSWGQPLCQWHDVHFETTIDGFTDSQVINGDVAVGGMGIESTDQKEFFANPKANNYFIDEYFSEKFTSINTQIAKESFNLFSGTFAEYKSSDNTSTKLLLPYEELSISKILLHKTDQFREKGTIGSWKRKSFLHTSTSSALDFNPFFVEDMDISINDWNGIYQSDNLKTSSIAEFSLHGITYQFERNDTIIESRPIISNYDIFNSINYQSKTHDIVEYESGLMIMRPSDSTNNIRHFKFGPPVLHPSSNALSLNSFKDAFNKNNQFLEITKKRSLSDAAWKESVRIFEFDFSKTVFFEYSDFLDVPNNIFYTPVLDTPFVHKVFFVNLNIPNYGFTPFVESPTTKFLIEQDYFHSTVNMSNGPKNKFKHLMIEELYRPKYRDDAQVYEFNMNIFESVSSTQFDYKKFGETFYEPITTKRPGLSGGSNAFGHDLLTIDKRQDVASNFKTFSMEELIENSFGMAGRAGRHRDNEYRETHIIERYEYTSIDYDLETHTTYNPDTPDDIEDETFNWVYTIDDDPDNGRIPECLELEDNRIIGQFTDTDKFLRQYQWQTWMKTQGTTDDAGNFVPLLDTLDFDYADFDLITPRQWEVNITGRSITKGTIDLVYDGVELTTGDVMTQTIDDVESRFEIVRKVSEFDKVSDRATGSLSNEVIHRYEVENIRGEIEVTTLEETFTETFVSGEATLQAEKTRAQEELSFSTGIRKSNLEKKIEDLTNTIAENLITNPTGYGFISKTPAGKQINFNYVVNEEDDSFVVDDFVLNGSGAVSKFIKVIFKIRNNWSFDRDLRLFTDDSIVDNEFNSRTEWVNSQRENNRAVWSPSTNNTELDLVLIEHIKNYDIGGLSIDDFISERDFIIDSRDFSTPDQKTEYKEFLDTIIFKNLKSNEWERDINIINTLTGEYLSALFPLSDSRDRGERFDTISQTENDEQVYKLNCSVNVDEQTFYNNIDTVQVIRGYPVYASCN